MYTDGVKKLWAHLGLSPSQAGLDEAGGLTVAEGRAATTEWSTVHLLSLLQHGPTDLSYMLFAHTARTQVCANVVDRRPEECLQKINVTIITQRLSANLI